MIACRAISTVVFFIFVSILRRCEWHHCPHGERPDEGGRRKHKHTQAPLGDRVPCLLSLSPAYQTGPIPQSPTHTARGNTHTHRHTRHRTELPGDIRWCRLQANLWPPWSDAHTHIYTHTPSFLTLISCPVSANTHALCKISAAGDRRVNNVFNHASMTPILTNTHTHTEIFISSCLKGHHKGALIPSQ